MDKKFDRKPGRVADVQATVSVPIPIDKGDLQPEIQQMVVFGGEEKSVLNATMERTPDGQLVARVPSFIKTALEKLPRKRQGEINFRLTAREFVAANNNMAGVVCRGDGFFLDRNQNRHTRYLYTNLGGCAIVKAKGNSQEFEITLYRFQTKDTHQDFTAVIKETKLEPISFPAKLANRFTMPDLYASTPVPDQETVEKLLSSRVDKVKTALKVGDNEVINPQEIARKLIPAMACAYRMAAGAKTSYEEVGPRLERQIEVPAQAPKADATPATPVEAPKAEAEPPAEDSVEDEGGQEATG